MTEIGSAEYVLTTDASGLVGGISSAEQAVFGSAQRVENRIAGLSGNMAFQLRLAGFTMMGFGTAVMGSFGAMVSAAGNFEASLYKLNTIAQLPEERLRALGDTVLELSTQVKGGGKDAYELVDGLYQIQQAGFEAEGSLDLLEVAVQAAAAGFTSTDISVKVIAQTLKAYGLEADKARYVSDILFKTVDIGIVTYEELATTFGLVLGNASALRVPLEEIGGAIVTLTQRGLTASRAMTSLNMLLSAFIDPSAKATKAAEALGFELNATNVITNGLLDVMRQLVEKLGLTPTEIELLSKAIDGGAESFSDLAPILGKNVETLGDLFGNVRSLRAALGLIADGGALYTDSVQKMNEATQGFGMTQEAFNEFIKSNNFQIDLAKNRIEAAAIVLGGIFLPVVGEAAKAIGEFAIKIKDLDPRLQKLVVYGGLIAGAWLSVTGAILVFLGFLPAITAGLQIVLGTFTGLIGILISPSGLSVIGALALLATAWATNFAGIRTTTVEVVTNVTEQLDNVRFALLALGDGDWGAAWRITADAFEEANEEIFGESSTSKIQGFFDTIGTSIEGLSTRVDEEFIPLADRIAETLGNDLQPVVRDLGDDFGNLGSQIGEIATDAAPSLAAVFTDTFAPAFASVVIEAERFAIGLSERLGPALENIGEVAEFVISGISLALGALTQFWKDNWDSISDIFAGAWQLIVGVIEVHWAILKGIIFIGLDLIGGRWGQAWTDLKQMVDDIWIGIVDIVSGAWQLLDGVINTGAAIIYNTLKAGLQGWLGLWDWVVTTILQVIETSLGAIDNLLGGWPSRVLSAIGEVGETLISKGVDLVGGLLSGIKDKFDGVGPDTVVKWFTALPSAIFGIISLETITEVLYPVGWDLIQGIYNGIVDGLNWLWGILPGPIKKAAKDIFGFALEVRSPSQITYEMGLQLIEGLKLGVEEGLPELSGAAAKVAKSIADALGAIVSIGTDLNIYEVIDRGAFQRFVDDLIHITGQLSSALTVFNVEGLAAAAEIAKSVESVVGIVKTAVDNIGALGKYVSFEPNLTAAFLDDLVAITDALAVALMVFDPKAVETAAGIAKSVESIVGIIKTAVDNIISLQDYVTIDPNLTATFLDDLIMVTDALAVDLNEFNSVFLQTAAATAGSVTAILETIKTGVDALTSLKDYSLFAGLRLEGFMDDMMLAIDIFSERVAEWDEKALEHSGKIATTAGAILTVIGLGIDLLTSAKEPASKAPIIVTEVVDMLVGAINQFVTGVEAIDEAVLPIVEGTAGAGLEIVQGISDLMTALGTAKSYAPEIRQRVLDLTQLLADIVTLFGEGVSDFDTDSASLTATMAEVVASLVGTFGDLKEGFRPLNLQSLFDFVSELLTGMGNLVDQAVGLNITSSDVTTLKQLVSDIIEFVTTAGTTIAGTGAPAATYTSGFEGLSPGAINNISSVMGVNGNQIRAMMISEIITRLNGLASRAGLSDLARQELAAYGFVKAQKGLWNIPGAGFQDNFPVLAAPGEMVLDRQTADAMRKFFTSGASGGAAGPSVYLDFRGANFTGTAEENADAIGRRLEEWWERKKHFEFGYGAEQWGVSRSR